MSVVWDLTEFGTLGVLILSSAAKKRSVVNAGFDSQVGVAACTGCLMLDLEAVS
jgi:hypothetical protein